MNKLSFWFWYLFFSAYWSAKKWGAISPESNASGLIILIALLFFSSIYQVLLFKGYSSSVFAFALIVFIPALALPYYLFRKKNKYLKKIGQFEYLKDKSYDKKRVVTTVSVFVVVLAIHTGIAILRNIYDTN